MSTYLPSNTADYRTTATFNPISGSYQSSISSQQDVENNNHTPRINEKPFNPKSIQSSTHFNESSDDAFNILPSTTHGIQKNYQNEVLDSNQHDIYSKQAFLPPSYTLTTKQTTPPTTTLASPKSITENVTRTFSTSSYEKQDGEEDEDESGNFIFLVGFKMLLFYFFTLIILYQKKKRFAFQY